MIFTIITRMNIFYLHRKRKRAVKYYVDKHVVKMPLETAQLLCTALWFFGMEAPYRMTHKNHPSAIWTRQSKANFYWLKKLGIRICNEYTYRYGKVHKCEAVISSLECPDDIPDLPFTQPPQCMPDEYKVVNDSVQAYQNYYKHAKKHLHSWKGKINSRKVPEFIN